MPHSHELFGSDVGHNSPYRNSIRGLIQSQEQEKLTLPSTSSNGGHSSSLDFCEDSNSIESINSTTINTDTTATAKDLRQHSGFAVPTGLKVVSLVSMVKMMIQTNITHSYKWMMIKYMSPQYFVLDKLYSYQFLYFLIVYWLQTTAIILIVASSFLLYRSHETLLAFLKAAPATISLLTQVNTLFGGTASIVEEVNSQEKYLRILIMCSAILIATGVVQLTCNLWFFFKMNAPCVTRCISKTDEFFCGNWVNKTGKQTL